jgi:hypothetical protein
MPLVALVQSNRTLWSAARESCDLYLPSPLSSLVSLKLIETQERRTRPAELIESLQTRVDFPDVRALVNSGAMSFEDVMKLRRHAVKFRQWLQRQSDRDTDALLAYHHEIAKESGFLKGARKTLRVFGVLGGAAAGATAARLAGADPTAGATLGAVVGNAVVEKGAEEALKYLFDMAGRLDENWRPVVFGDWAREFAEDAGRKRRGSIAIIHARMLE